jgi:Glyoxalase-like domain
VTHAPAPSPSSVEVAAEATAKVAAEVDHLVVAAATLEQGVAWCEATLGATPGPGGQHALFGTHNRLMKVESEAFPAVYLEIIAIDPAAPAPPRPRWFGLDEAATQERLARHGPGLLHVVVRTAALDARLAALAAAGLDAGEALAASRQSAEGLLQWRIAVRPDGRLLHGGALPTLIEWRGAHPTRAMAPSPVRLRELTLGGLPASVAAVLGPGGVRFVAQSPPALRATFDTLRGPVTLESA